MAEVPVVSTVRSTYQGVSANIGKAIDYVGPLKLRSGNKVVIKINLCAARTPDTGTITHPLFLSGALQCLRERYQDLDITVVESDATVVLADRFVKWFGIQEVLDRWGARFVNLSTNPVSSLNVHGRYFKEVPVPSVFETCDYFINMPKPKTNPMSTITCCLKNVFGCLPNPDKGTYHSHLDSVIADINKAIPTDLAIVDGVIAMGGAQGPSFGVPIPLNAVICGVDPVAVDAYCARLMGFSPRLIGHIRKSASSGVGTLRYRAAGDKLPKVDFEVNKFEYWLVRFGGSLGRRAQAQLRTAGKRAA